MIIFLYGSDSYRRLQKQKEVVGEYKKKHSGLTIDRFYLDESADEWVRFKDFASAQSLFGGNRLAMVSGGSEVKEKNAKELAKFLNSLSDSKSVVVLLTEENKLNKDFNFLLKKPVLNQEFKNLTISQFNNFVTNEAKKRGIKLSPEALKGLVLGYLNDTWGAVTELDKLALAGNFCPYGRSAVGMRQSPAGRQLLPACVISLILLKGKVI